MNGSVFTCFLDASKAFDRVNDRILFTKLGNRGTTQYIIRILSFWYANQQMCIRWGGTYSTSFNVSNGVRQGSILSPVNLNACRVGCCVGNEIINHLSRRSRIFPRRGPLSCEVPSRRDSVGGGVVAEMFCGLRKPSRFSGGGGVVAEFFRGLRKPSRFSVGGG